MRKIHIKISLCLKNYKYEVMLMMKIINCLSATVCVAVFFQNKGRFVQKGRKV